MKNYSNNTIGKADLNDFGDEIKNIINTTVSTHYSGLGGLIVEETRQIKSLLKYILITTSCSLIGIGLLGIYIYIK